MLTVNSIYDILIITDLGILTNNNDERYILFMNHIHKFILESEETHFDYQLKLLEETNYIITRLYETCNEELKQDYYEMRELNLNSLERIQDDKNENKDQSDDEYEDKNKHKLPIFRLNSSKKISVIC